ncbi:hypothetical protein ACFFX0_00815 [Citricoccus parietis]|uniref:Uncharacterized protein n=1 Tax=Citricoccus parietis TaxID=592307 RepID=A0ABV5FT00_9MICC
MDAGCRALDAERWAPSAVEWLPCSRPSVPLAVRLAAPPGSGMALPAVLTRTACVVFRADGLGPEQTSWSARRPLPGPLSAPPLTGPGRWSCGMTPSTS